MLKPFLGFFKSNKYSKMTLEYENGDINDEIEDNHHEDETVHDFIEAIEFLLGIFLLFKEPCQIPQVIYVCGHYL